MAAEPAPLDEAKVEAFVGKALGNFSATMTTALTALGDRLGLFKDLAQNGPATAAELAERAGVNERYAAEWLRGMAAAEYLEHDRGSDTYTLPPEHAVALANEGANPAFLCGTMQMVPAMLGPFDQLTEAFRNGGGVQQAEFGADWWDGMQRFTAAWFESELMNDWMPALPHVHEKLERGAAAADVGCGSGRASIAFAQAYPDSTFVGFDAFEGQVERAQANADAAGVGDRVRFELLDVAKGLPDTYDLVTTFDVIHDAADPGGLIKAIREGTKDDGDYLMLEINCADDHADNQGELAAMFYGFSVFYCMTTSLANGGAGLGTCGMPEAKVRELCNAAGFSRVDRLPFENPFNTLFDIRP
jgi:2-polyprenyl-3-methyl-5-hydroxy-6-metoxy-1,4-benzoquinol methylase